MPTPSANEQQIVTEREAIKIDQMEQAGKTAQNPEDLHAQMFYLYAPIFKRHLEHLNKKALIRLISSLIEVPLNEKEIKLRSKVEQNAFQIGDQLLTSKFIMMIMSEAHIKMLKEEERLANEKKPKELPIVLDKTPEDVVQLDNELKAQGTSLEEVIKENQANFGNGENTNG